MQREPRSGTKERALFDAFVSSPGVPIMTSPIRDSLGVGPTALAKMIEYLSSSYELDIRRIRNGLWVLAGRWDGSKYTDYIAPIVGREADAKESL